MINNKNERGFTLVSMLFAFFIATIALPFIPPLFNLLDKLSEQNLNTELAIAQFFHFIQDEIYQANEVTLTYRDIIINKENGESVNIQKYGKLIRRQVNFKGHEPILFNVNSFIFSKTENTLTINISVEGGEHSYKHSYKIPQKVIE